MLFLVLEIIIFLVLALLLGTLLGYLLSRSMMGEVKSSVEQLKLDVAGNRKRLSAAETDLQLHKSSLNELRAALDGLQERLSVHSDKQADLSGQMEGLVAARSALSERTANLASQVTEAHAGLGRQLEATQLSLGHRLDGLSAERDAHSQRLITLEGLSEHLATEHRMLSQRVDQIAHLGATTAASGDVETERIASISDRVSLVEERVSVVANDGATSALQLADLRARHTGAEEQLKAVRSQLDALGEADQALSTRLESVAGLPQRVGAIDESQQDLSARVQALETLPKKVDATRAQVERMQSSTAALTSRLEHQDRWGQETDDRIEAIEGRLTKAGDTRRPEPRGEDIRPRIKKPVALPAAPVARPNDDLKLIRGVGVALERTLNEAGIRYFEQIAAWGPEDVGQFTGPLVKHQGRILRDDWMAQARALIDARDSASAGRRKSKTVEPSAEW